MPLDGMISDGANKGSAEKPTSNSMTEEELLEDRSLLNTCGSSRDVAVQAIRILDKALASGRLDLSGEDMPEDALVRTIKAIGKLGSLKGLLPARTSAFPFSDVNLSGNSLLTSVPGEAMAVVKSSLKRRAETVQLVVQFVRVSTEADKIKLEDCSLQGLTHDKDDLVEQEVIRLVKKFGAGKQSKFAREVSLAGNRFGQEFARRIIEAAYWERNRHPDKDDMPTLQLNLSRNRIRDPSKIIDELKIGKTAGGPMNLAVASDSEAARREALIVIDFSDQRDRSATPARDSRRPAQRQERQRPRSRSRSERRKGERSVSRSFSRRRSPSGRRARSPSSRRGRRKSPSPARKSRSRSGRKAPPRRHSRSRSRDSRSRGRRR
ncbi:unnamed protein product [Polarella glacialis]|uniref:Uncharacterized protein n=1 Tax=Polarella glacialis TaxID=89957 RepID=A0A813FUL8_POLGL|nr:unnamed protein product [Polarella glacialis]CAE8647762.1 unnamed protein product [Polarella glacialis]